MSDETGTIALAKMYDIPMDFSSENMRSQYCITFEVNFFTFTGKNVPYYYYRFSKFKKPVYSILCNFRWKTY